MSCTMPSQGERRTWTLDRCGGFKEKKMSSHLMFYAALSWRGRHLSGHCSYDLNSQAGTIHSQHSVSSSQAWPSNPHPVTSPSLFTSYICCIPLGCCVLPNVTLLWCTDIEEPQTQAINHTRHNSLHTPTPLHSSPLCLFPLAILRQKKSSYAPLVLSEPRNERLILW